MVYQTHTDAPAASVNDLKRNAGGSSLIFHIAALGISHMHCTLKPPVDPEVFSELVQLFMKDGVLTATEPLLIQFHDALMALHSPQEGDTESQTQLDQPREPLPKLWHAIPGKRYLSCLSLSYVKGFNRTQSLAALNLWMFLNWGQVVKVYMDHMAAIGQDFGQDFAPGPAEILKSLHPEFYQTSLTIHGHHVMVADKLDEGTLNLSMNVASQVRRAPHVLTNLHVVQKLTSHHGLNHYSLYVKKWNSRVIKGHCLTGKKAQVLKLLMEQCPKSIQALIVQHCNRCTWNRCVWSEDALANKKLYPGHRFPAKSIVWQNRLKVSEESMHAMVRRLQQKFELAPAYMKNKKTADEVEKVAELACVVVAIAHEILLKVPVKTNIMQEHFIDRWANGCMVIDGEITALLFEKSELMDPLTHVATLKTLVEKFGLSETGGSKKAMTESLTATQLEVDEFNLLLRKLDYDVKAFKIYRTKMADVQNALFHGRRDFKRQKQELAVKEVERFLDEFVLLMNADEIPKGQGMTCEQLCCWERVCVLWNRWPACWLPVDSCSRIICCAECRR